MHAKNRQTDRRDALRIDGFLDGGPHNNYITILDDDDDCDELCCNCCAL